MKGIVGGGTGRGSSVTCIRMEGIDSFLAGGIGGLKCLGRVEVVPIARLYIAHSVVVKSSLMTPLESCHPFECDSAKGGTIAAWIVGRPKAAKLAAICLEVQQGRGGGCWAIGVLFGMTTSFAIVVVVVCQRVTVVLLPISDHIFNLII